MDNRRNHEHYMDLTAYQAIKNIEGYGEKMELKKGEIYEYDAGYDTRKVLIVSSDERKDDWYVNGILLEGSTSGTNLVKLNEELWADCDKISLLQRGKFGEHIATAIPEEMAEVDKAILEAFDLYFPEDIEKMRQLQTEIEVLTLEKSRYVKRLDEALDQNAVSPKMIKLEAEKDFYKHQYEMLLERLISK